MLISLRSLDKGILYEEEASSLNVKTTSGEITILNHHRPLMTELEQGDVVITNSNGSVRRFGTLGGFLEVNQNKAIVLLD